MIFHWGKCDHGILCGEEVWGSAKKGSGNKINCLKDCQQDSLESCPVGCQKELIMDCIEFLHSAGCHIAEARKNVHTRT